MTIIQQAVVEEPRTEPASGEPGALVLIHGRGANERDLLPWAQMLDPRQRLLWALPRGPHDWQGMGWHWYHIEAGHQPELNSFNAARQALRRWLTELLARHEVPLQRTVVAGFSQGAAMAFDIALGPDPVPVAGLLPCSGYIPGAGEEAPYGLQLQRAADLPVFIQHGAQDPVVAVQLSRRARDLLQEAGADLAYHEFAGMHHVDAAGTALAKDWLLKVLP